MGFSTIPKMLKRFLSRPAPVAPPSPRAPRRKFDIGVDPRCAYAIGDIHGCIDKLRRLEQAIVADAAVIESSKLLVYLGDYIDRGPDSSAVLEHLMAPPPAGFSRVCLCGNHEEALIDLVDGRRSLDDWLRLGGERTLLSYGYDLAYMTRHRRAGGGNRMAEILEAIPKRHIAFLRQLPSVLSTPSYIFVHAGLRPGVPLTEQQDQDLLWIREPFLTHGAGEDGRLVIHGHTPGNVPVATRGRVGVDTGAYMGGQLTAVRLMAGTMAFLDDR
ncbi:metallophosphoesterase family protein [Aureimonas sp. AU22]|uniref:metallophosphoesterase family protein n=1 Tax=Aureimonas sp. AU22 TaxID=1638162 RepID=UPI0007057488|nr:metallophosphoesterase family protein [Aureimonas sp. AU22]BAT29905.1 metallophosphoesterase [Aureimonas sp. AU22]